jgi:hypothetical protein
MLILERLKGKSAAFQSSALPTELSCTFYSIDNWLMFNSIRSMLPSRSYQQFLPWSQARAAAHSSSTPVLTKRKQEACQAVSTFLPGEGSEWLAIRMVYFTSILAFLFNEFYFTGGMRRARGEIRLHDKVDLHVAKNKKYHR